MHLQLGIFSPVSHTLFNPEDIIQKNGGKPPLSYQSFVKVAGQPSWASSPISTTISSLPCVGEIGSCEISKVPTVEELGYEDIEQYEWTPFRGGESEALKRLRESINNKDVEVAIMQLTFLDIAGVGGKFEKLRVTLLRL
ncbi:hypothetical protein GH714_037679 [Hevea brasiliensis]|uniref:Uncharacterized protein n=1 Tax=Hevea brasiliensis TaxID=3981 RepID=A0A6A6LQ30_HEVBR|nr:hypothetical protein GH714_037679 [Hevea brasiliensis]